MVAKWSSPGKVLLQGNVGMVRGEIAGIVNPGKGGGTQNDLPVFDLVKEAIASLGPMDTSVITTEPYGVLDAALEAIASSIHQLIILAKGIPPLDLITLLKKAEITNTRILGPGSKGIVIPQALHLGTLAAEFYLPGTIAILTDSEGLAREVTHHLHQEKLGISAVIHLGSEKLLGSEVEEWLLTLERHPETQGIVFITRVTRLNLTILNCLTQALTKPILIYPYGLTHQKTRDDAKSIITTQLSYTPGIESPSALFNSLKQSGVRVADSLLALPPLLVELKK